MEQLESLQGFATGYVPPVTFSAARRLGARGAWIARLDLGRKRSVPGGWVEVE